MRVKPVVSAFNAWSCIVISVFAIVILSVIGGLFKSGNHALMGATKDPENESQVAGAIFGAVVVYACFIAFCGLQALLHARASRRGAISLN